MTLYSGVSSFCITSGPFGVIKTLCSEPSIDLLSSSTLGAAMQSQPVLESA